MNTIEQWQEGNNRYLSAAIQWVRKLLEKHAVEPTPQPAAPTSQSTFMERFLKRSPAQGDQRLLQGKDPAQQAAEEMAAAAQSQPPPTLEILSQRLGLSDFERSVLLLCAAMELDTQIAGLCARIQDGRPYPTFALALTLFEGAAWDALSPERPLRHFQLLRINQPGATPLTVSPLQIDEHILNYIKGLSTLDDRLTSFLVPIEPNAMSVDPPPSHQAVIDGVVRHWRHGSQPVLPVAQLLGPHSASKQAVAARTAAQLGVTLYCLPASLLPGQAAELETLARLWERESRLFPMALYVDAQEQDSHVEGHAAPPVSRFLSRYQGIAFLASREPWPRLDRPNFCLDVAKPTSAEQRKAWSDALGDKAGDNPDQLSAQFSLDLPAIREIAQAELEDAGMPDSLARNLWNACRRSMRPLLEDLAQRIEPKATWDYLVLSDVEKTLLRQIASQVRHRAKVYQDWGFAEKMNRGLGISVLFAGPSGTGKTMAAEVIANELNLDLYRIDLSSVISKYIGETEKNLSRVFAAAEDSGTLLLFDEADALFGKRTEVKDAHDFYAGQQICYLLQRMESYRGLAILATNKKEAMDSAFLRRLRFVVDFPMPGQAERKAIWEKAFPEKTRLEALDYDRLARLNFTGALIGTAALNAAFMAAENDSPVTMDMILNAARDEYKKSGRPINEKDFRILESAGGSA